MRKRFGKVSNGDVSEMTDLLSGDFVELDKDGSIVPGGIFHTTSVFMESMKNEEVKKLFVGLKPDEKVKLPAEKTKDDAEYFARLLGNMADKISSTDLQFTLKTITRMTPADLGQEFFDKVYGPGTVNNEAEFRGRIREELDKMFRQDSDVRFMNEVQKALLDKAKIALPDAFLKKYLHAVNEKKASFEEVAAEYSRYADHLKWQLIENKIIREHQIAVTHDEAVEHVKEAVKKEFAKYGKNDATDEELKQTAEKVLTKEGEDKKVYDRLYEEKLAALFKKTFTITEKEVSQEEFFAKK
jgi:trigger factor